MADLQWHDDGSYHWCTWSDSDSNSYDYHIRLAGNSYRNGGSLFNMFSSLPNVNAPSGGTKVAVLNGGIFYSYNGAYYNEGFEIAWYQNILQENFGQAYDNCLAFGSWGSNFTIDTQSTIWNGGYPVALCGPAKADGTGQEGPNSTRAHSFVGKGGSVNYMGYVTSGYTGSQVVSKMTGKYGGRCMILDGGGSTQMWYQGSTKISGDGRNIKNAIVLYRTVKSPDPPHPPGPDPDPPIPGTGIEDNRRLGAVAGKIYALHNGSLKGTKGLYALKLGSLAARPDGVYELKNNSLQPRVLKYDINYKVNGGSALPSDDYYWNEKTTTLAIPTHSDVNSLPVRFWGWFNDNTFTKQYGSVGLDATGDRDYYAKWLQYKMQYQGFYIASSSSTKSIPADSYSGSASPVYFSSKITHNSSINVTKLFANFDNCTSSWTSYIKPRVDYGYFTGGEGSSYYHNIGTLYSQGEDPSEKSVNYTVPAGSSVGFRVYQAGGGRTLLYLYDGGYYKYGEQEEKWVSWQDSSNPPSGSWKDGYPEKKYVQRIYNGSSWNNWEDC